ncbi:hypothetical protein Egran_06861 [Elaphomyces granulatus]|uniref:Uncharacterized protein n=1 Tax=Elaphomyces granulatus TaxID=519963 RepID=A0A232LMI2_9EURO|nr:hypothetical protein Egran_06861 [Elaphomyces granulatus]
MFTYFINRYGYRVSVRLCGSEGKRDEAEKMYQWALQGKEKAWGSDHTVLTLDTVNNLSFLYKSQFKLDEVYQWALQRCDSTRRHNAFRSQQFARPPRPICIWR